MKWTYVTIAYLMGISLLGFLCLTMLISGKVSVGTHGFGVDSNGRLYVGMESSINVYEDGILVKKISTEQYRAYNITITKGDVLVIADAGELLLCDENGVVKYSKGDPGCDEYERLEKETLFHAADGHTYELGSPLGRTEIVRDDGTVVYQMTLFDYGVKLFLIVWVISYLVGIPTLVFSKILSEEERRNK